MQHKKTPLLLLDEGESPRLDPEPVLLGTVVQILGTLEGHEGAHKWLNGLGAEETCS